MVVVFTLNFHVDAQGTFQNLNFESANVSGYSPDTEVPISVALRGWNGFYGTSQTSEVGYDIISIGGAVNALVDNEAPAFQPLQGNDSAFLFGGVGVSATISQTGTIPTGTESIFMDAFEYDASPIVAINGQSISMMPVESFENYTLYGGTVPAADVGQSVTLSLTDPAPQTGGPSMFEVDDITFSPNAVPEPSTLALVLMGGVALGARRWRARGAAARAQARRR